MLDDTTIYHPSLSHSSQSTFSPIIFQTDLFLFSFVKFSLDMAQGQKYENWTHEQ